MQMLYLDPFSELDFRRLDAIRADHCVSIYIPVTGGAFPRKVGGENRTVTAGRRQGAANPSANVMPKNFAPPSLRGS
jgi:hypothetical protein